MVRRSLVHPAAQWMYWAMRLRSILYCASCLVSRDVHCLLVVFSCRFFRDLPSLSWITAISSELPAVVVWWLHPFPIHVWSFQMFFLDDMLEFLVKVFLLVYTLFVLFSFVKNRQFSYSWWMKGKSVKRDGLRSHSSMTEGAKFSNNRAASVLPWTAVRHTASHEVLVYAFLSTNRRLTVYRRRRREKFHQFEWSELGLTTERMWSRGCCRIARHEHRRWRYAPGWPLPAIQVNIATDTIRSADQFKWPTPAAACCSSHVILQ